MNDYASFPSQSTQLIQEETDSKSNGTLIIDNDQNHNSQSSIHSKLERLNININGVNINGNTNTNSNMSISSDIHYLNNDRNKNLNKNNPQTLIKNNKESNIVLMKLPQTLTPSTPKQRPTSNTQSAFHHASNNRLKPSSAIKSNHKNHYKSNGSSNGSSKDIELTYNGSQITFEPPSQCTNDPGAPIISLEKAKKEFKTVSQAAFRFQFVCDAYRKCKLGTVKEKDFAKLEDIINYVHDQLLKRRQRNSQLNLGPSKSPLPSNNDNDEQKTGYPDTQTQANNKSSSSSIERPPLIKISSPICSICNKSFPSSHCYTTCNHPLCIKCLVQTFNHQPKNPRWFMCPMNGCRAMLPPQAHFLVLSYKPSSPNDIDLNNNDQKKQLYKKMMNEYLRVRNISYKNMLKIVGEYFSSKLKYYERWRKCENCDFGFLADPDVNWYQVFELKCVVCNVIQRVQLLGPDPCNTLKLNKSYYPNDNLFKTLVFIRHGEAENNVRPSDPSMRDPNLTQRGKQQCKHLNQYFGSIINVECILSSTMNRCLQTAAIGIYKKDKSKDIPWIALEVLRERLSPSFNRRETISIKKEKYKILNIDWSECLMDDDVYFDKEKKNEKYEDMNKRAWQFYKYLIKRPEQTIAIVSHEGMLQCLMNIIDSNDKCLRRSFKNAEARLCFMSHRK